MEKEKNEWAIFWMVVWTIILAHLALYLYLDSKLEESRRMIECECAQSSYLQK